MRLTLPLTCVAMIAFAANSLLTRAALAGGAADALTFTAIRLVSGSVVLVALLAMQGGGAVRARPGSWPSALALFAYAVAFSLAYLRLGAATGALILFASVQGTMIAWGILRRDRPSGAEIVGLAVAFAAFVYLVLPGLGTPDPVGAGLMVAAGMAWGVYSLRGRGTATALAASAGNFVRAALLSVPALLFGAWHVTGTGLALAVGSGAVASGLGYVVWYRALGGLSTTQAATVQLTVPMIAAFGGVALLGEVLTGRLVVASLCILGGVAVAILSRRAI